MKQIQQINKLVQQGLGSLRKAGETVITLTCAGLTLRQIAKESGVLSVKTLKDLVAVAEDRMAPAVAMFKVPASSFLKQLPLNTQEDILENGVDVVRNVNGLSKIVTLTVNELKRRDCEIAFYKGKIRDFRAQKRALQRTPKKRPSYKFENGRLYCFKPIVLNKETLTELLNESA